MSQFKSVLTPLESQCYKAALNDGMEDYSSSVKEIAERTGIAVASVKGAVGSLVKKGLLVAEEENRNGTTFLDIFPIWCGEFIAFGGESANLTDEQFNELEEYIK